MLDINIDEKDALLKGTTAVAFFINDGIIVAVDSRTSNEWVLQTKRKEDWKPTIRDTANKVTHLSKKIIAISVGASKDCTKMFVHIHKQLAPLKETDDEIELSHVADIIYNYLVELRTQNKGFGTLIAGHDEKMGFQIYRILIDGDIVIKENDKMIASLGSGSGFANHILVHGYDFNMSKDDAQELAIKAIMNSSFFEKNTGGPIHTFLVTKEKCLNTNPCEVLNAYLDNFEHYDQRRMLFLMCRMEKTILVSSDHILNLFRLDADILVAHRVDERASNGTAFFLHRLVFTSEEEAMKALNKMHKHGLQTSHPTILSHFPYRVILDGGKDIGQVPLFVGEVSKEVLEFIINNCPISHQSSSFQTKKQTE